MATEENTKKVTERQRVEISSKIMAAIIANANNRGIIPNADMMARETLKYTEALITELEK